MADRVVLAGASGFVCDFGRRRLRRLVHPVALDVSASCELPLSIARSVSSLIVRSLHCGTEDPWSPFQHGMTNQTAGRPANAAGRAFKPARDAALPARRRRDRGFESEGQ